MENRALPTITLGYKRLTLLDVTKLLRVCDRVFWSNILGTLAGMGGGQCPPYAAAMGMGVAGSLASSRSASSDSAS